MPQYLIQYTQGNTLGPFDIYLSGSSGETLYASGVTKNELVAGYVVVFPDGVPSSSVVVTNTAFGCSNEEILLFPSPTPTITPTNSIPASITPTPTVTPTITPTRTVTPTITPTRTPPPTAVPTITPSITPTLSIGATITPTPTPTITRTPSITPSTAPLVTIYEYTGCGYGSTVSEACSDTYNNRTLYSDCDTFAFGVGCTIYVDSGGNTPLTSYTNVFMNGANWDVNQFTGVVTAYSSIQC
jgi:hypothetical protein